MHGNLCTITVLATRDDDNQEPRLLLIKRIEVVLVEC